MLSYARSRICKTSIPWESCSSSSSSSVSKDRCCEEKEGGGGEGVRRSDQYHAFRFGFGFGVKGGKGEGERGKGEAERRGGTDNSAAQLCISLLAKSADGVGCPLLLLDRDQPPTPSAMPIAFSLMK